MRHTVFRWLVLTVVLVASLTMTTPAAMAASDPDAGRVCIAIFPPPPGCGSTEPVEAVKLAPLWHNGTAYLNTSYCAPNMACTLQVKYQWAWSPTYQRWVSIASGSYRVAYLREWYPWGYRWVYSYRYGWLAVQGGRWELPSTAQRPLPLPL